MHAAGGVAGFVGAGFVGLRYGKEKQNDRLNIKQEKKYGEIIKMHDDKARAEVWIHQLANDESFQPNSIASMVTGTLILVVSWLFFNAGSAQSMYVAQTNGTAKIMMNTILGGTSGGISGALFKPIFMGTY